MSRKISIVGAGLVGCLWSILLKKRGYEVEVFEKRSDFRNNLAGAGRSINLIITSRGMHALDQAGLLNRATELAVPVYGRMIHALDGSLSYQPYGQANEKNLSISRLELNKFLLNVAEESGIHFYFDHSIEKIDLQNKQMSFATKTERKKHNYDLVFGTDGASSLIRKTLCSEFPDQYQESIEWLAADYKELFVPKGSSLEMNSLHIWPRGSHMMMALANLDQSFTVTLYLPKNGPESFASIKTEAQIRNFFATQFSDSVQIMPGYITDYQMNPVGTLGTVRLSKWVYQDSVVLMGDAAHAIVPFFGQGMNSGFEDCTALLSLLENENDWTELLRQFDVTRRPNTNAIADLAIENWYEMSEKVADPKFLLRKKVENLIEKNFPQHFKSRYGMVTYTLLPYDFVKKVGVLQAEFLNTICANITSPEQIDLLVAKKYLETIYLPKMNEYLLQN